MASAATAPPKTLVNIYQSYTRKTSNMREKLSLPAFDETHQKLMPAATYGIVKKFFAADFENQREQLQQNPSEVATALIEACFALSKDKPLLTYLMLTIDAIILDDAENVQIFIESSKANPKRNLVKFLQQVFTDKDVLYNSSFTESAVRVLCAVLSDFRHCDGSALDAKSFLVYLTNSFLAEKKVFSDYILAYAYAHLLMVPGMPAHALEVKGPRLLLAVLEQASKDLQTTYFALVALWILSYEEAFRRFVADPKNLVLAKVLNSLRKLARDKLIRVALKLLVNLLPDDACVAMMVDNNLHGFLASELKKNLKDGSVKENIARIMDALEKKNRLESSWEKYVKELRTEKLVFGPCHTEKFWKEHVKKAEEGEFFAIKKLIDLLDSPDQTTQCVCCFDLGEFCRLHPYAKMILEKEQGKNKLMLLVNSEDATVREAALIAVQKLMVNNWQLTA